MENIAKIFGCSPGTIRGNFVDYGIQVKPQVKYKAQIPAKETLVDLYHNKKLTIIEIADLLAINTNIVGRWLKKYNIESTYFHEYPNKPEDLMNYSFSQVQKEMIIGTVLEDACILPGGVLSMGHCVEQKPYLEYKVSFISEMCRKLYYCEREFSFYQTKTFTSKYIKELRKLFCPNGTKIIPREIKPYITPFSLAILYMDDGTRGKTKRMNFATHCFTRENQQFLLDCMYEATGARGYIYGQQSKGKYIETIWFKVAESKKLSMALKPYIIPSMTYKLIPLS